MVLYCLWHIHRYLRNSKGVILNTIRRDQVDQQVSERDRPIFWRIQIIKIYHSTLFDCIIITCFISSRVIKVRISYIPSWYFIDTRLSSSKYRFMVHLFTHMRATPFFGTFLSNKRMQLLLEKIFLFLFFRPTDSIFLYFRPVTY